MSNTHIQTITKDVDNNFKEVLSSLVTDPSTPKMIHFDENQDPILREAPSILKGIWNSADKMVFELDIPVGKTYSIFFDVLLTDVDFSVSKWSGSATVQNTGGIVGGVGPVYYHDSNLLNSDWWQDGIGSDNGVGPTGPAAEISDVTLYFDTNSRTSKFYLVLKSSSSHEGAQATVFITINKIIKPLSSAYSSSSPATPLGPAFNILHQFRGSDGLYPTNIFIENDKLYGLFYTGGENSTGGIYSINLDGSNFQNISNFTGDGSYGGKYMIYDGVDSVYAVVEKGGTYDGGAIKKVNIVGTPSETPLYYFDPVADGSDPQYILISSYDNMIYGVCYQGGQYGFGTLFKMSTTGNDFTVLHHFSGSIDGKHPTCISQDLTGRYLFGTCMLFDNSGDDIPGMIWSYPILSGTYSVIKQFPPDLNSPIAPRELTIVGGVPLAAEIYGCTTSYISEDLFEVGTIYNITEDGSGFKVIHIFRLATGNQPIAAPIFGPNNKLLGTTTSGGLYGFGGLYQIDVNGLNYNVIHYFDTGAVMNKLVFHNNYIYGVCDGSSNAGYGYVFSYRYS